MAPKPEQEKPQLPPCGHCGWTGTTAHCFNALCTWIKCGSCNRLTDTRKLSGQEGSGT